jgi:5'-deoxynucleotidase YfbR-like HD superfamily hydrolase
VAEHSYYVAIYATAIAKLLSMRTQDINWITQYSLTHDFDEMVSGDIPTPYKKYTVKDAPILQHLSTMAEEIQVNSSTDIKYCKDVVKVADIFEACMYLSDELGMGNRTVAPLLQDMHWHLSTMAKDLDGGLPKTLAEKVYETPRTYLYSSKEF